MKKEIYYIGNAHIDHTWWWRWIEGYDEIYSTFRAALERMKEDKEFVFTCSSALHYKWIEEEEPEMFKEIQQKVKEGQWQIAGGWWVQPDNNIPNGESFARQGLYAQLYFKSRFGKMAKAGYCVDSFGHNGQIPQIITQQNMRGWIGCRPEKTEMELPAETCMWQGIDGTKVAYSRPPVWYCSTACETIESKYDVVKKYLENNKRALLFYGIGDHGGGPTTQEIKAIRKFMKKDPEFKHVWGNLDEFYDKCWKEEKELPVKKGDLQYCFRGCYTTQYEIKRLNRLCENKLHAGETLAAISLMLGKNSYKKNEISNAWQELLANQFHDVICGTCPRDSTEDSISRFYSVAHTMDGIGHFAARKITSDFDSRAPRNYDRTIAVSLVNPIPRARKIPVEIQPVPFDILKNLPKMVDANGNKMECQNIISKHNPSETRLDRILFVPEVPSCGAKLFHAVKNEKRKEAPGKLSISKNVLKNKRWKITIDKKTGNIKSLFDLKNKIDIVKKSEQVNKLLVIRDLRDTWGTNAVKFDNVIGEFKLKSIKILESGPLRASFEIKREYNKCQTRERISLYRDFEWIDFSMDVLWTESFRMLKVAFPLNLEKTKSLYEIPFGAIQRPVDGSEQPMQRWMEIKGKNKKCKSYRIGFIGKTIGAADVNDNEVRLSLVRSPLYGYMNSDGMDKEVDMPVNDQGLHTFEYRLFGGIRDLGLPEEATDFHIPHEIVFEGSHKGSTKKPFQTIVCEPDSVQVSAIKQAEDGKGVIIRLYETRGRKCAATIRGPKGWRAIKTKLKPYEIQTFRWNKNTKPVSCNMLEEKIRN